MPYKIRCMVLYINNIKITIKKEGNTVQQSKYGCIFSTADKIDLERVCGSVLLLFPKPENTRLFFDKIEEDAHAIHDVKIITHSPKHFVDMVFSDHKTIKAGGGIVENDKGEVLMIFRNGLWDFPKGKLDKGESIEECAVREVEEECRVSVNLHERICKTRHTYKGSKDDVMKITYWYRMSLVSDEFMHPQLEEGIEKVEWKSLSEAEELLNGSFKSLTRLLRKYQSLKGINSPTSLPNL